MVQHSDLTKRQQQVLDYIVSRTKETGYPPSVREICDAVGLSSTSSVHSHLKTLEEKGYIKRNSSSARALAVLDSPEVEDARIIEDDPYRDTISLPVVGKVAAGEPILAEQNIEDRLVLPRSLTGDDASFLLRIKGESMIEAGIFDGDYVVVREQPSADNGDIVVAMLDDGATVKTFYKEPDRIRLQPENSSMSPIYSDQVIILGKVVALFRSL